MKTSCRNTGYHMTFEEVLKEYRIPYVRAGEHHHARSGWLNLDCCFCSKGSGRYRMGYSLYGKYVNCWTCGPHRIVETLVQLTNLSPSECFKLVGGLDFERARKLPPSGRLVLPSGLGELKEPHASYLHRRGFDPDALKRLWGIQGIGLHPRLSWRVFIPVTHLGQTVSWTTRATNDRARVRYLSASPDQEAMPHRELLYGEDYCRHAVVVHEGPLDVWRTGPGAVATMGTVFTRPQVRRLSKYPVRVVCFDNEPDAQRRARELCRQLEVFPGQTFRVVLDAKDAGSATDEEISDLRKRFLNDY